MNALPADPLDPLEPSRRHFLKAAVFGLCAVTAALTIWPLAVSFIAPAFRRPRRTYSRAGRLDQLPAGEPRRITFPYTSVEGFIRQSETRDVWVIRHSDTELTVFSPICTHLSCRYDWNPQSRHFVCPCHGSVFSLDGKVLAGPAPRPLDTLSYRIENGQLLIQWELFKSGIAAKVPI